MNEFMNNYEVKLAKTNASDVVSSAIKNDAETIAYEMEYEPAVMPVINAVWFGTIMTAFIVWIVCIISLILNVTRRNNGKAIFSGIGILAPIICIFMATLGRVLALTELRTVAGLVMVGTAAIIQVIFIIVPFIFCFSKNKNKENKPSESNKQ